MRLIFHGQLRTLFGPDVVMVAHRVGDAIEGFSRQVAWPKDMLIDVVGFNTPESFHDFAEEVHIMPAMRGGGGKFGSIILGAAVVALGVALIATPFGIPLIVSGGLMIAQGVIGLFLKSPTIKGVNDPEASKYLPINRNTTAVGTVITMAWGTIDLAGHWLSLQSDSNNISYGVFPA
jgi:hypothetical protein